MHYARIGIGSALALVLIGVSAFCNWHFGLSLASGFDAQIYALLGASADLFKALMPLMIAAAWAASQHLRAALGALVFAVLTTYSLTSAIGLYSLSRANTLADVKVVRVEHERLSRELSRARQDLSGLGSVPLFESVASALAAAKHDRIYTRSAECTDATANSSRVFCARLAGLNGQLAIARDAAAMRGRIRELEAKLSGLDLTKVVRSADPQAEALARLTGSSPADIRTFLALMIAILIELGSGLGLWLATAGIIANRKASRSGNPVAVREKTAPDVRDIAGSAVEDWAQTRLAKSLDGRLPAAALCDDYRAWCAARGAEAMTGNAFGRRLSQLGFQRKRTGGRTLYVGVALASRHRAE